MWCDTLCGLLIKAKMAYKYVPEFQLNEEISSSILNYHFRIFISHPSSGLAQVAHFDATLFS